MPLQKASHLTHSQPQHWLAIAFAWPLVKRSLMTAIIVGLLLIVINQHQALLGEPPFNWLNAALTMIVPYCVSTYSGTITRLRNPTLSITCNCQSNTFKNPQQ